MRWRSLGLLLALALSSGCGDDALDPLLEAVLPDRAAPDAQIDVLGQRLQGTTVQVSIGGKSAAGVLADGRRLRVRVPALPAGRTLLTVTVDGRVSNPLDFTVD